MKMETWPKVASEALEAVVAIDTVDSFSGEAELRGTGFVIREDGFIATNAHVVVRDSLLIEPEIWVRFRDERRFIAKIVFIDLPKDVAVVKINANRLPYLEFETRRAVRVGQEVISIGNAVPYEFTVSNGIISNLVIKPDRPLETARTSTSTWIQLTAPLNPGCSGGPILNRRGNVVGMNVAISPYHRGVNWGIIGFEVLNSIGPIDELHLIDIPEEVLPDAGLGDGGG
jgi:serine protease Do